MQKYNGDLSRFAEPLIEREDKSEAIKALGLLLLLGVTGLHQFARGRNSVGLCQLALFCLGVVYSGMVVSSVSGIFFAAVLVMWLLADLGAILTELMS